MRGTFTKTRRVAGLGLRLAGQKDNLPEPVARQLEQQGAFEIEKPGPKERQAPAESPGKEKEE